MTARCWVWLDAAATCNLRCAHCYTLTMQSRGWMRAETWSAVLRAFEAGDVVVEKFHLNWRGEPLSNPRLESMVADLSTRPWPSEFHTNGTLMTRRRAEALCAVGSNLTVQFSIDGGTASSFEGNRGPGTWPKALAGLAALLRARGTDTWPRIGVHQLDLGIPESEYDPRFVDLLQEVDEYKTVTPIEPDGALTSWRSLTPPQGPCFWLGHAVAVDHQGGAHTCILETNTRLGSLLDVPLDEVLRRASDLRRLVTADGRGAVDGCSGCFMVEGDAYPAGRAPTRRRARPAARG